ncbi:cyclase family protein [Belliella kenyensis]|uniref:Cyclase family protein n=1 Tax=Belliella kenyensis TaxID=1472724 RepID=A0ABV8EPJ0_9BACT|nr:cyclase family protein [Belliella kenyensis]MCH7403738.1 cyclase family protein [Belliella kenyensis]MDN3602472.1 cyclase family protein [Belliella kenyensis]
MGEIIDLSQEIYSGMPVFNGLPKVHISVYATHEQWEGIPNPKTSTPSVKKLEFGEHTGTHVDALSHMGIKYVES